MNTKKTTTLTVTATIIAVGLLVAGCAKGKEKTQNTLQAAQDTLQTAQDTLQTASEQYGETEEFWGDSEEEETPETEMMPPFSGDTSYYKDRIVIIWGRAESDDDSWYRFQATEFLDKIGENYVKDEAGTIGFIMRSDTVFVKSDEEGGNAILFDAESKPFVTTADAFTDDILTDDRFSWFFKNRLADKQAD
jgi:outer membrane murein-binding lipoprotein Lpp